MKYEIINSSEFDKWLKSLSNDYTNRVLSRLYRLENGNFGDYKRIDELVYELRFSLVKVIEFITPLSRTKLLYCCVVATNQTKAKTLKEQMKY